MTRCLYLDLDGTLLGRGASMLHDGQGEVTLLGVRAVEACLRAGVEVVLMSGRRRAQVHEDARLLSGSSTFIFESGACLVLDGEEFWMTEPWMPDEQTIHEQVAAGGAPELLLTEYAGRLEYHDPWHTSREVTHLFRGLVDAEEVDRLLAERGHGELRLVDNGTVHAPTSRLTGLSHLRGYHLLPRGASKARAAARHMRARGYAREEVFAVGDSREDLDCVAVVGRLWLVANALERDPSMAEAIAGRENVSVTEAGNGPGVYEAVVATLVSR